METKKVTEQKQPNQGKREAGMMVTTGVQGVGKTYQNMHLIKNYVSDKIQTKVKGRKCLIFDTNGEYSSEQFNDNHVPNFHPKRIALKDIPDWSKSPTVECRRIDAKHVSMKEKREILEFLLKHVRNALIVVEDINTYILSVTHMEEVVGGLVNLRHRACDVLVSYQSLRAVEPRMWQNARWIRMHYQQDNVSDIKGKVANPAMMKIAQIIVNNKYFSGDKRFFVYIHNFANKIEGKFSKADFLEAAKQYLSTNKKDIKEHMSIHGASKEDAADAISKQLLQQYYGNV